MHEQLIERLFSDSESRAIASEFAKECSRTGITDNRVEALLNESAVLAQRAATRGMRRSAIGSGTDE